MKSKQKILSGIICSVLLIVGTTSSVYAFSSQNRSSKIESEGVLTVDNTDGDEVVIAVSDFEMLADSLDELEYNFKNGVIDTVNPYGIYFSDTGNPSYDASSQSTVVKPTCSQILDAIDLMYKHGQTSDVLTRTIYHVHIDGNYNEVTQSPIYTKDAQGGCYVAAGHTHNATGTCPSHIVHHSAVTDTRRCNWHGNNRAENDGMVGQCPYHPGQSWCNPSGGGYWESGCNGTTTVTISPAWDETVYDCGNYVNTWVIGCGKNENTVENTIVDLDKDYTYDEVITGHR